MVLGNLSYVHDPTEVHFLQTQEPPTGHPPPTGQTQLGSAIQQLSELLVLLLVVHGELLVKG